MSQIDVVKTGGEYPIPLYPSGPGEGGNVWRAQQFTAGVNNINGIVIPLERVGSPAGNAIIEIQTDVANYPSGSVIATYTIPASTIPAAGVDYYASFTANQLIPGNKYHVCLKADEYWDATNAIYWRVSYGTFSEYASTGMSGFTINSTGLQFDITTYYDPSYTVYQYADVKKTGGDTSTSFETNYWYAQQFQPARPNITGVELKIAALGAPTGTLTVEVQTDLGNAPSGCVCTSATLDISTLSTTLAYVKFDLPLMEINPISQKLWICVKGLATWDGTDGMVWSSVLGTYSDWCAYGPGDFSNSYAGQFDMTTLYNVVPVDYSISEPADTFPHLTIFDTAMDPQAILKSAEVFTFTEDWYYPATWELKVGGIKPGVGEIELKGHVGWKDAQGVTHIGIIEKIEQPRSRDSMQWTVSGRGSIALLGRRRCMEEWTNVADGGYDIQSGVAYETALRHYVNQEVIAATDTDRRITGVSLNAEDYLRGVDSNGDLCVKSVRADPLLDVIQDLCLTSTLGCDLIWTGATATPTNRYTWRFDVYSGTDRRNTVKLSVKFSNVLSYKYAESILNLATVEYVAGEGDGATRALEEVYITATAGSARFEDYVDAADCITADARTERGLEMLSQKVSDKTFEFEYNPQSQNAVYGVDFFLGDIITVSDPETGITMIDRINTVTTTYTDGGKNITIGMGTRPLDLLSLERISRKRNGTGAKS